MALRIIAAMAGDRVFLTAASFVLIFAFIFPLVFNRDGYHHRVIARIAIYRG